MHRISMICEDSYGAVGDVGNKKCGKMENILVEADKTNKNGFILSETELRRIIQLVEEQITKTGIPAFETIYEVKYENGAIATTNNLEHILKGRCCMNLNPLGHKTPFY